MVSGGNLRKILVKSPNWAGDVVMCLPALNAVRSLFPVAEGHVIHVLAKESVSDLLFGQTCCDEVLPLPDTVRQPWKIASFIERTGPYDMVVSFTRQERFLLAFRLAGIPIRVGYGPFPASLLFSHPAPYKGFKAPFWHRDQATQYFSLVKYVAENVSAKEVPPKEDPTLFCSEEHRAEVKAFLAERRIGRFCCVPVGTSKPVKQWPLRSFVAVVKMLVEEQSDLSPVLLFGPNDTALYREYVSTFRGALPLRVAVVEPGRFRWGHLVALLSGSEFVLVADAGPRHVAAVLKKKVIAIVGPTDPNRAVYSSHLQLPVWVNVGCNRFGCDEYGCTQDRICMAAITPRLVFNSIRRFVPLGS